MVDYSPTIARDAPPPAKVCAFVCGVTLSKVACEIIEVPRSTWSPVTYPGVYWIYVCATK